MGLGAFSDGADSSEGSDFSDPTDPADPSDLFFNPGTGAKFKFTRSGRTRHGASLHKLWR